MKLDFLTLYIVILLNSLTVAIIWAAIAYRYRTFTTARIWLLGCILTTLGGGILALQGNEGSYAPAVIGNGVVIFGFCLFWMGIRHFYGLKGGLAVSVAITAASLFALLPLFDSTQGRNLVYAAGQSAPLVLAIWYLLREKRRELGAMIAAFAMIVGVAGHAIESGLNIGLMLGRVDGAFYSEIEAYALLCVIFSGVVWNFGFAVMTIDRLREELSELAHKDDLTGVPNRRQFLVELEAEDRRARRSTLPFSLLLIDIDRFKQINDTKGHAFGDRILRRFVEIVHDSIQSPDTLFRLGGDEFAILLPEVSARQAEEVAGKLVAAVRSRSGVGAKSVRFTISVGVAEWSPDQSLVGGELMAEVDGALYKAKAKGRDGYAIAGLDNLPDSEAAAGKIRLVS